MLEMLDRHPAGRRGSDPDLLRPGRGQGSPAAGTVREANGVANWKLGNDGTMMGGGVPAMRARADR